MDKRTFVVDRRLEAIIIRALNKYRQQLFHHLEKSNGFIITRMLLKEEIDEVDQALAQISDTSTKGEGSHSGLHGRGDLWERLRFGRKVMCFISSIWKR